MTILKRPLSSFPQSHSNGTRGSEFSPGDVSISVLPFGDAAGFFKIPLRPGRDISSCLETLALLGMAVVRASAGVLSIS